jgi:hypothetical protein
MDIMNFLLQPTNITKIISTILHAYTKKLHTTTAKKENLF